MNKFSKLFLGSILALGLASCGEKPEPTPAPEEKVKVTFDYNYETFDESATSPAAQVVEVVKGEKVAKPAEDPQWSGWTFVQWCTTQAAVTAFDFTAPILADTTIYAAWREEGAAFDTWTLVGSFDPSSEAGTGDQWNPNSDTYKLATEDGIHYSIAGVSMKSGLEFQVIKEHDWAGQLQAGKVNKEASTPNCYSGEGGANIKIELSGVYTVDLDLSVSATPITITKTADLDIHNIGYSVNVLGQFNNWAPQNADVEGNGHLQGDVALSGTYTGVVAIEAHQQFKVTVLSHFDDESTSIEWFGPTKYARLVDDVNVGSIGKDDPNFEALKNGNYTFTVVIPAEGPNALTISVTVEETEPAEKPAYEKVGLVGSNNNWGNPVEGVVTPDTPFVKDESKRLYTLTTDLVENGVYKVRPNDTWNGDLGYGALTNKLDSTKIADDGGNIKILVAGSYDFAVEYDEMNAVVSFTLVAHGETPVAREFRDIKYYCTNGSLDKLDLFGLDMEASVMPAKGEVGEKVHIKFVAAEGYVYNGFMFWDESEEQILDSQFEDYTLAEFDVTIVDFPVIECYLFVAEAPAPEVKEVKTSINFTAQGYENQQAIESAEGENFNVAFSKGTNNNNAPKYYTSGAAIRCYGGNTITVSSEYKIVKITLAFASGEGTNEITVDAGTFESPDWTGEATVVVFTIGGTSGHRRIASIEVTVLK